MQEITFDDGFVGKFKTLLSEVSLSEYIQYMKGEQRLRDTAEEVTYLEMDLKSVFGVESFDQVTPDLAEVDREEFERIVDELTNITQTRAEVVVQQLKIMAVDSASARFVDSLDAQAVGVLKGAMLMGTEKEAESGAHFVLPGCNDKQIEDLENYISEDLHPEHDAKEIFQTQARISRLKKHTLILESVADAAFAAFMRSANLEQSIPQMDEEAYLAVGEVDLQAYFKTRATSLKSFETVKEKREKIERDKMIRRFIKSEEQNFYDNLPNLLTLFFTPIDEPFSIVYSNARIPYIEKMNMYDLMRVLNFIEAVLLNSEINTAISGTAENTPRTESLLTSLRRRDLTFLESGAGL